MVKKTVKLSDIISFLGERLLKIYGSFDDTAFVDNLADIQNVNESTLDWINPTKANKQKIAEFSKAKIILVDNEIIYSDTLKEAKKILLVVKQPKVCLANIGNEFFVEKIKREIHSTAIIHPEAIIGKRVAIGANCVIGNSVIGDDCILDTNIRIYDGVSIGVGCSIKSGAVIGGEGFGFEKDENGNHFRFPQIGGLYIGNYVEIGSNTCIDRGALSDTIIGDYTKINNLCHIAHNNKIGQNVTITACVNISGSNIIGDNVWIAPNSSVRGWVTIGNNVVVGMGAVVVKDIPDGETWAGCPAKKLR